MWCIKMFNNGLKKQCSCHTTLPSANSPTMQDISNLRCKDDRCVTLFVRDDAKWQWLLSVWNHILLLTTEWTRELFGTWLRCNTHYVHWCQISAGGFLYFCGCNDVIGLVDCLHLLEDINAQLVLFTNDETWDISMCTLLLLRRRKKDMHIVSLSFYWVMQLIYAAL